jgi:hypothetical protein
MMQEEADDLARRIAAMNGKGKPGRVHVHLGTIADQVVKDKFVREAGALGGKFVRLPIPDGTVGVYGECDGVVVRMMRDYDFHADRVSARVDAATAA